MLGFHLQAEDDQAASSQHVASQRSTRFLWTAFGLAVLMLIGVLGWERLPVASHAPTTPSHLLPSVAFAPFLPASSAAGVRPASHPVSSRARPTGLIPAVVSPGRQRPRIPAPQMSAATGTPQQRYSSGFDTATEARRKQSTLMSDGPAADEHHFFTTTLTRERANAIGEASDARGGGKVSSLETPEQRYARGFDTASEAQGGGKVSSLETPEQRYNRGFDTASEAQGGDKVSSLETPEQRYDRGFDTASEALGGARVVASAGEPGGGKVSSSDTPEQRYSRGFDTAAEASQKHSKSLTKSDDSAADGEEFDAIVIGGGSGGSGFAKRAAGYGKKVCLIERGAQWDENGVRTSSGPGGTCVNVGCVPKKLMFNAAAHREMMVGGVETAKGYGFDVPSSAGNFDWGGLKERRDAYVKRLNDVYEGGWEKLGITVVQGTASLLDAKSVSIQKSDGSTQTMRAKNIVIAAGGIPSAPNRPDGDPIPGVEHAINSDSFFELQQQPKKVAVIGAGYIAVEMAGIFHALGSETHLFFRGDTVMRKGFDPYIVETLMENLKGHGPILHPLSSPAMIHKNSDGLMTLGVTEGADQRYLAHHGFDVIMNAAGRKPVTERLDLDKAGVVTEKGYIKVDEYENTNVPGVYALGDITTAGYELTPVAIAAGRRLADRIFGGEPRARIEYNTIATVVFSHPPIGMIGLTEPDAKKEYGDDKIVVKEAKFGPMFYAFNDDKHKLKTAFKLVLKLPEERIVGLHMMGTNCDEMMQGFAVAIRMGATRADFEASVAIHPTSSEEMVTFGGWGLEKVGNETRAQLPPYLKAEAVKDENEELRKELEKLRAKNKKLEERVSLLRIGSDVADPRDIEDSGGEGY